ARSACAGCHTVSWPRFLATINDQQLDRDGQLARLRALKVLPKGTLSGGPGETKRLSDPRDASAELDARARSYLHVNCAVCHRPGGGTSSMLDLRIDRPLKDTFALDVPPALGAFALRDARIIAPGDPSRSVLFFRIAKLGHGRMPHVGSTVVDEEGVALIGRWIDGLPPSPEDPAAAKVRAQEREAVEKLASSTAHQDITALTLLLASTSGSLDLMRAVDSGKLHDDVRHEVVRRGALHPQES